MNRKVQNAPFLADKSQKDAYKQYKMLQLLTSKPVLYVCNVDEASASTGNQYVERVREVAQKEGAEVLVIAAKIESEIAEAKRKYKFKYELTPSKTGDGFIISVRFCR
mgnify:CR=1 FL=1